jgi:hypothetical protein
MPRKCHPYALLPSLSPRECPAPRLAWSYPEQSCRCRTEGPGKGVDMTAPTRVSASNKLRLVEARRAGDGGSRLVTASGIRVRA